MAVTATPTRSTPEAALNEWNIAMRNSPRYQQFLESIGQGHGAPTQLSRHEQSMLEDDLRRSGIPIPGGMHIDQGGNLNQKNHLARNVAITVGITAAAIATAGAAGYGPLAGAMSGSAGAGGAAAGAAGAGVGAGTAGTVAGAAGAAGAAGGAGTAASILGGVGTGAKILAGLKSAAPILGGMANARYDAQSNSERNQIGRDSINLRSAEDTERAKLDRANLDMDQRKFQVTAPGQRLSTGVRGSMVSRAHNVTAGSGAPVTLSSGRSINPIHFSGMGPDDLLSPEARQLGEQTTATMLEQAMKGDKFDPIDDTPFPSATPERGSSFTDKAIGTGSTIAGLGSAILPMILGNKKPKQLQFPGGNQYGSEYEDGEYL